MKVSVVVTLLAASIVGSQAKWCPLGSYQCKSHQWCDKTGSNICKDKLPEGVEAYKSCGGLDNTCCLSGSRSCVTATFNGYCGNKSPPGGWCGLGTECPAGTECKRHGANLNTMGCHGTCDPIGDGTDGCTMAGAPHGVPVVDGPQVAAVDPCGAGKYCDKGGTNKCRKKKPDGQIASTRCGGALNSCCSSGTRTCATVAFNGYCGSISPSYGYCGAVSGGCPSGHTCTREEGEHLTTVGCTGRCVPDGAVGRLYSEAPKSSNVASQLVLTPTLFAVVGAAIFAAVVLFAIGLKLKRREDHTYMPASTLITAEPAQEDADLE